MSTSVIVGNVVVFVIFALGGYLINWGFLSYLDSKNIKPPGMLVRIILATLAIIPYGFMIGATVFYVIAGAIRFVSAIINLLLTGRIGGKNND